MIEITRWNVLAVSVGCLSLYAVLKFILGLKKKYTLNKWAKKSENKVILHGMYGGKLPSSSPFVLKVETYLRMAKIPYEIDKSDIWGPKGKTPWISIKGQHISDSQFILDFLGKKYEKHFDDEYSDEQRAIGTAVRIMMEEYLYWGAIMWRFAFSGRDTFAKVWAGEISFGEWCIFQLIAPTLKSMAWTQGMGRHSETEILLIMNHCLCSFSKILGSKPFLFGKEPCEIDCAVFGQLAAFVFLKNSPFEQQLQGEYSNIKHYCIRMKEEFWSDWNELIGVSNK